MIVIVSAVFPPEPVVTAMLSKDIADKLSIDNKVIVLSPQPTRPFGKTYNKSIKSQNYTFEHIIMDNYTCPQSSIIGRGRESYSFGKKVELFIEKNKDDISVIYANTWPLFSQKIIVDVLKKYNIPLLLHVQDIYPESISKKIPLLGNIIDKIFLPMDKYILNNSTKIITISDRMKKYLISTRKISSDKIKVIRNWQNDKKFMNLEIDKKSENELFTFMYVGSINPTANVELVIESFINANLSDSQLIIAGDGPEKKKCYEKSKNYNNIKFMSVEPDEVPILQSKSDVLILPLKKGIAKTALPSKLTAYMLSSKPILASVDLDSEVFDIISNNNCGIVCNPDDEIKLIEKMNQFHNMKENILYQMGVNSFNYATTNLTKKINLKEIVGLIKNIEKERNA